MKSLELKPTYENLVEMLKKDTIFRNENIFNFVNILNSIDDSCSIALDGGWGSGKTFFVKQVKMVLEAYNDFVPSDNENDKENDKEIIRELYACYFKFQEIEPQMCVYYDAWENDNDDDPMMSLVYSIMKSVENCGALDNNINIAKAAASVLEFFTGKRWSNLVESLKGNSPLKDICASKSIDENVKEFLDELMGERGNRLVVFVDELDRCKPSYAVKVLERIKHYFTNDRITFVFSINTSELQHTIRQYYGNDFNADRYLDRFFDWRFALPPANLEKYYQHIGFNSGDRPIDVVMDTVIQKLHLELREIEKYKRLMNVAVSHYMKNSDSLMYDFRYKAVVFSITFFMPIALALKMCDSKKYNDFVNGNGEEILLDITSNIEWDYYLSGYGALTQQDKNNWNSGTHIGQSDTLEEKQLKDIYQALFLHDYNTYPREITIGNLTFSKDTKNKFLSIASLLSSMNEFDFEKDKQNA